MTQTFIVSISEKLPDTWERHIELQSWGLATDRPVLGRAANGDEAVARGTITATSCVVPMPASIDAAVASAYLETRYQ